MSSDIIPRESLEFGNAKWRILSIYQVTKFNIYMKTYIILIKKIEARVFNFIRAVYKNKTNFDDCSFNSMCHNCDRGFFYLRCTYSFSFLVHPGVVDALIYSAKCAGVYMRLGYSDSWSTVRQCI